MASARQILDQKNGELAWLPPTATVLQAAQLMNERHIGSVVIMQAEQVIGIFTERDVMRRVVAEQRDAGSTQLEEVMTTPIAVATSETSIAELQNVMRERRIRHIPVVDDERAVGMVSIGDLNRAQHDVDEQTIRYLERFISVA